MCRGGEKWTEGVVVTYSLSLQIEYKYLSGILSPARDMNERTGEE